MSDNIKKIPFVLLLGLAMMVAGVQPAQAQEAPAVEVEGYCDPQVMQDLVRQYQAQQKDLEDSVHPLLKSIKDKTESALDNMASCVDLSWPNITFQRPTMDQILNGVARQAVNRVCGEVRQTIREANSHLHGSYYLNTRIPGVPSIGGSVRP